MSARRLSIKGKKYLVNFAFLFAGLCFSILEINFLAATVAIISIMLMTRASESDNLFHMTWLPAIYVFSLMPAIFLWATGVDISLTAFYATLLYSNFALMITGGYSYTRRFRNGNSEKYKFLAVLALTVLGSFLIDGQIYYFLSPLLIVLYACALQQSSKKESLFFYFLLFLSLILYSLFLWKGFGRLVLAGWLILPTMVLIIQCELWFNKYIYCVGICIAGLLMAFARFDVGFDSLIQSALGDSTFSPFLLMQDLYEASFAEAAKSNWAGMLEQFGMFFYGALPRAWWADKPLGFGFEYTVANLPESYVDAGHSVAALFLGEHLYYLGLIGFFTCALAIMILVAIFKLSYRFDEYGIYAIPVVIWVLTYVWGGISAFSQRFQLGILAVIFFFLIFPMGKRIVRKPSRPNANLL